jgi:glycosyltransferase involved in cell wall biosynthesis
LAQMLYIDVCNTLRGGLRTGIQRVVRALAFELATNNPLTRLIAFDPVAERYFALVDPALIRTAGNMASIGREARAYFDFDAFAEGDVFFEPDSTWTELLNRSSLFRLLKSKGVIVVVLNHDAIPMILPEACQPNMPVAFSEYIADHIQYADYALTTSNGVDQDLRKLARRFLGRSMTTRVIKLGADFETLSPPGAKSEQETFATRFPELAGLRFLLCVGTIDPRKNQALLVDAFDRLEAEDAGLVIVGRKGWRSENVLSALESHPGFGKRLFWYGAIDDSALLNLYRQAYASVLPSQYEGYGLPALEALMQGSVTSFPTRAHCRRWRRVTPRFSAAATAKRCFRSSTVSIATRPIMRGSRLRRRASDRPHGARLAGAWPLRSTTSRPAPHTISQAQCGRWCFSRCTRS